MKIFVFLQLASNSILTSPTQRDSKVITDDQSRVQKQFKRSTDTLESHQLLVEIKTVDDSFCSVPNFPLARNIDCTGKLATGKYCEHVCGETNVRSTCAETYQEVFGVRIYTGRVLTFDNECAIEVVERESKVIGFSALAESRDKCKEYIETSVVPKLEEKLLEKCSNECEVKIEGECEEVKRKRRSNHLQFDVSLDLTVMALNEEDVTEVTVEDIQKAAEEVTGDHDDGDVELTLSQVSIETEDIEVKTEVIQPIVETPDEDEDETEEQEDSEDKHKGKTEDEIDETIREAVEEATAPFQDKIDSLEDENLNLFVKIKLMEDETKTLEANFEEMNSKMRKNQLYNILQSGQSQSEIMNLKTKVDQIMTDLYDGFFNNFGKVFQ